MPQEATNRISVTAFSQLVRRHLNGFNKFPIERALACAVTFGARLPIFSKIGTTFRTFN